MTSEEEALKAEVDRFRQWAEGYPVEQRSGEWECDYEEWGRLYEVVLDFVASQPVDSWTAEQMDAVLYTIARDNEMGNIVSILGERHPAILCLLAVAAVEHGEPGARWQLAVELGKSTPFSADLEALLLKMAGDEDEYVRRRALMVLARFNSQHTEQLALAAWYQAHEHQQWARMAALWSLHRIQSLALEPLRVEAEADPRPYLSDFAQRIRRGEIEP